MEKIVLDRKFFGEKVKKERKLRGLSQEQLAETLKISDAYVSRIERGEAENVSDVIMQMLHQFLSGGYSDNQKEVAEGCVMVDIFNMVEAGPGAEPQWHEPIDRRMIPAGLVSKSTIAVLVRGRSMEPTFRSGAIIGVDLNDKQVVDGEAYAVLLPYAGAAVKRIYPLPNGVLLRSDNKEFPEVELKRDEIPDCFILGRVRWVVQEM